MAARAGTGARGRDRRVARGPGQLQLHERRSRRTCATRPGIGGGGLYDIGCYPIVGARFLFAAEPTRVASQIEYDPNFETDRLASVLLQFPTGQALFYCSTQLVPYQRMQILGTKGRIEIEIPFNAPPDRPCRIFVDDGSELGDASARPRRSTWSTSRACRAILFARAIREGTPLPFPLEDAVANMRVLDAVFRGGRSGRWEEV